MRKIILSALFCLFSGTAFCQSNPGFYHGEVPTAAQWNAAFATKQDVLSYTPLNIAGGVMTGELITNPSSLSSSGFNIPPGVAPTSPVNGDLWATSNGVYARVNGETVGPFGTGGGGITGPGSTTVNDFACWNNTIGTLLKDCTIGIGTAITSSVAGYGLYIGTGGSAGLLEQFTYGAYVFSALGYALNNPLGLPSATSPVFGGISEFTGSASVVNLQSPPADIFAVSAGGATLQVCYLTGCIANDFLTAVYGRWTTALDASKSEYLFSLDSVSNTGLSPPWTATTPFGAAWVTGHVYPGFSYVTSGGNLYYSAPGGTSGPTAPNCPTLDATCSDGAVTWGWLSATPSLFYVNNAGNLYSTAGLGTSGATPPTCVSGTCSDGVLTWTYVNNSIVANKVGAFYSWVTHANVAGGSWGESHDVSSMADNSFMIGAEFDFNKGGQIDCTPGVIDCYTIYVGGYGTHTITAYISFASPPGPKTQAFYGMLIAGPYSASTSDIEIDDNADIGLGISTLVPTTHSIASIQDISTSPVGLWLTGTYSFAAITTGDGVAGWGLALGASATSGANVVSQSIVFNYFNASSVENNMTWTAGNNVMFLGSTEAGASVLIPGLASGGTSCVQAGSTGQLSITGSPCGSGSGAVGSVTNSDGSLTISPTTGAVVASLNYAHAGTYSVTQNFAGPQAQITLGANGGNLGKIQLNGSTSGSFAIEPQAAAGSPLWMVGTSSGTPAVTASSPLTITAATGNIAITGAVGGVLAGAGPAFTPTPTLGTSGTLAGSIALYGNTSTATITIVTAYTGSSAYNATIPALTASDTFDMIGLAQTLSNKTLASPVFSGTASGSGTIPIAVLSGFGPGVETALAIQVNHASGFPLVNTVVPTVGDCLQWGSNGVTDAGGPCTTGGGGGTVSSGNAYDLAYYAANGTTVSGLTTGISGQFLVENGSVIPTWVTASGDCTLANTGALTCTKTSGTAFGALATVTPGTGVPTAVSVNIGTAGSFVVNGGALGTPSSGTATYLTGLPLAGLASQAANTVVGALTATTPSALAMPSCYGAGSALQWQIAAGFQCNTSISAASAPASGLTGTTLPSGVTLSSLTSVGTLTSLTTSGLIIVDLNSAAPAALTGSGLQIVAANSTAANVEIMTFGVDYPSFVARTANGTEASPSGVLSGAVLADFDTRPFDGTSWASVGTSGVHMVAQENFSATAHGSYLDFRCTAPTTTTQLSCGTVTSTGFQGAIGATTAATGKFTTLLATSLALNGATIGSNALAITGTAAISSTLTSAADTITSASANALAVGLNGATNPAFNVDASTASSATGINIKSAAAAGGLAISVISSGTNEALTINAKGSGTIGIGNVSTGAVTITPATTLSAALTYGGVTLSNAVTGTGNMVLSASPTFSGTVAGAGTHPLSVLATQAANTVVGNATASSASPTALAMTSCSTAASAVNWTTSTGFGCNTSVTAAAVPLSGITGLGLNVPTALAIAASTAGGPAIYGSVPTIANFGAPGTITAPATTYYMGYQTSTTENTSNWITPRAGTFRNLYASVNVAPGTGQTFTVTLRVNGASPASGPTCTISAAATTCNDLTHTATITAGQPYDLLFVTSTTAAATVPVGSAELDQ